MKRTTSKSVTIQDVANAAGMAKSTVSRALTGRDYVSAETRETVLRVAQELGFNPNPHAQRLAEGRCHNTVALFSLYLNSGTGLEKICEIQQLLREAGFDAPLHAYGIFSEASPVNQSTLMAELCQARPRAVVVNTAGINEDSIAHLRRYQEEGGIVVCYDHSIDLECDQIVLDRAEETYRAAHHLVSLGHRRIGFFTTDPGKPRGERRLGFEWALRAADIPIREDWLFESTGNSFEDGGAKQAQRFLSLPASDRPSAFCLVNDYAALSFMAEVLRAGIRVPQELSIVSHDNSAVAPYCSVPLTTISHPVEEIAHSVVELLQKRLQSDTAEAPQRISVQGKLIVRESATKFEETADRLSNQKS